MAWHACERPEKAPDAHTQFHLDGCVACRIALEAATTVEPKRGAFRGWWDCRDEISTTTKGNPQ